MGQRTTPTLPRSVLLLGLTAALAVAAAPRAWQWVDWTSSPDEYFADDVMVAGIDSYHLFRVARGCVLRFTVGAFYVTFEGRQGSGWFGIETPSDCSWPFFLSM